MRAARLLAEAAARGQTIDRSGDGRFVETYPAGALRIWEFPWKRYKGTEGAEVRTQLVRNFAGKASAWLTLTEEDWSRCKGSDDMFDALVAALVARAAAVGCCEPIPSEARDHAEEEGWIALPRPGSLEELARGPRPARPIPGHIA
jgi:hypothetical protein